MEQTNKNYLSRLPDELKLKIFSYLDILDTVQLCEMLDVDHITFDSSLLKILCFYKDYRCDIPFWNTFILDKTRTEFITSLNINCIYWIPPYHLRTAVQQMPMLEHLYAFDTNLGLTDEDCTVYNALSHLQSLAVSVSDERLGLFPLNLINVHLHFKVMKTETILLLSRKLYNSSKLKNLWIIEMAVQSFFMLILYLVPPSVENLTVLCPRKTAMHYLDNVTCIGKLTFKSCDNDCVLMCFERYGDVVNDIYNTWNCKDIYWDRLINHLKYSSPFGEKEAKKMIKGESPLEIEHEELNIVHPSDSCDPLFKTTVSAILLSENIKHLKKLAINFCLAEPESGDAAQTGSKVESLFKKAQIGVDSLPNKSKLEKIMVHSPLIEELELYGCRPNEQHPSYIKVTNASLSAIVNLKYLKKLTLANIPQHIDGQFLIAICKSCKHLSSLRITAPVENGSFHNNMCLALPHSTFLKDFRYEFSYDSMDKIIQALNKMTNQTLERLVLKSEASLIFDCEPFSLFLGSNPQLKFVYIIMKGATNESLTLITNTAKSYIKTPDQVFVITPYEDSLKVEVPVPYIHKREMLEHHTNVSVLDILNGFVKH